VQQNRGIVAYFSLNDNTNVLVLVVVVPNSSHVTLARELAEFVYCLNKIYSSIKKQCIYTDVCKCIVVFAIKTSV